MESHIRIRGARTHNLVNVDVDLPRDQLIVITGLSGSGKSSLAFDTIYAEGQRRYVESLSAYARQFLSMMEKPDLDSIEGLSPAISIEQKSTSHNPRSTVGTVTEIHDYLRLLFARAGTPFCPKHGEPLAAQSVSEMVDQTLTKEAESAWMLLAPVIRSRKGEHREIFEQMRGQGFVRMRVDGEIIELDEGVPELDPKKKHDLEVVVDRFKVRDGIQQRLAESFETALRLSEGIAWIMPWRGEGEPEVFSSQFACPACGYSINDMEPRLFSFNSPHGACSGCDGLGSQSVFDVDRVITDDSLSLAGGAVRGWDRRNPYFFGLIESLAETYDFDVDQPWHDLPEQARQVILHGSGGKKIEFRYVNARGNTRRRRHAFEGVLDNMQRRYAETDSMAVREELAKYLSDKPCPTCNGARLNEAARHVRVADRTLPDINAASIAEAHEITEHLDIPGHRAEIARPILKEINQRLRFLLDVGLDYLTLSRSAETLSGGEAQRIRLASQIGAGLVGVMYVLDEPSIGLHQRDNRRLLNTLERLRDLGNTVIVVEHDEDAIREADYVVDMGPGAGDHGGHVIARGTAAEIEASEDSLTGQYLSSRLTLPIPAERVRYDSAREIRIQGARSNNLKNVSTSLSMGQLTCITGVSGSGKSTLINETLFPAAARQVNRAVARAAPVTAIEGLEHLDKVIDINQAPIGRTPRSNPATYTGLFGTIRELFANTPEARARGYKPGRFSFNVKGGRCETCQGDGVIKVEMHFLPDIYVTCETCHGARYNRETLEVHYKGKTIADVLDMRVEAALDFFSPVPSLRRKLETLMDVGLSYVKLGQNATTLSGGEAQRIKLARELSKRDTGRTLYLLDEPTTGLHFHDIKQLLAVLLRLREAGNAVVVIEHNLDVIKTADWLIDLGPEGGDGGGEIIATGTPEDVAAVEASHTGRFLKPMLGATRPGTGHNTSGDDKPTGLPPRKDRNQSKTSQTRKRSATGASSTRGKRHTST
ncbi:excinuclease ABC subunit UvrA [Salinisphaera orenii]|uniref:UvrABC system protein A n=1 Tax=Salinisphaera orenii YIM 95161 TaxID=1051139 RepID=A0A423QAS0_9GAMM|nr:excinuclease ABC subunit UvrA [Salinisphaera halophila]ROO37633.1 excinuclease ABC subunit A [Salinisphaera halophila YIM 95161]